MENECSRPSGDQQPSAKGHGDQPASTTELMESAKLLAGAAQSTVGGKADSIDKARVAEAAENLLGAAEKYGKLDESSGMGQYVNKAEDYLHKYHSSDSQPTETVGRESEDKVPVSGGPSEEETGSGGASEDNAPVSGGPREEEKVEETGSGGGSGVGDYVNMAKGFFK